MNRLARPGGDAGRTSHVTDATAPRTAAFVGSCPHSSRASSVRRITPGSAASASRICRASWIALRVRPRSATVAKLFPSGTAFPRCPLAATSPRSCAASYSSASRCAACDDKTEDEHLA